MRTLVAGLVLAVLGVWTPGATARVQPAGCPAHSLERVPANAWQPARETLAPPAAVTLRLCRYRGLNGPEPLLLARSRLITAPALLSHLSGELDALPRYPKSPAATSCPSDDGSQVLALLAYPGGERVVVAAALTGCQAVTNGDVTSLANGYANTPNGPRLLSELKSLTAIARVHGVIHLCGGPAPSRCFTQNATVTATGTAIATERTDHAAFSFTLPPGTYTLTATTGGTSGTRHVTLVAGQNLTADITMPVP